jgi:hypothetical protein
VSRLLSKRTKIRSGQAPRCRVDDERRSSEFVPPHTHRFSLPSDFFNCCMILRVVARVTSSYAGTKADRRQTTQWKRDKTLPRPKLLKGSTEAKLASPRRIHRPSTTNPFTEGNATRSKSKLYSHTCTRPAPPSVTVYDNTHLLFLVHNPITALFADLTKTCLLPTQDSRLLISFTGHENGTPEQDSRTPYPPILPHHLGHSPRGSRIPNSRRGMVHLCPNERARRESLHFSYLPRSSAHTRSALLRKTSE